MKVDYFLLTVIFFSFQLPNDILSPTYITNRLSPVLLVKFWNPDTTYAVNELSATGLASPMLVRLPLQKTTNDTYEVRIKESPEKLLP